MKQRLYHSGLLFTVLLLIAASGWSGSVNDNAGTSGFSFLKIDVGARAVAMGGAFTGLADDESALYYNPAGITVFEERRMIAGYHAYFDDMQAGMVGFINPIGQDKAFGAYISYLNYGDFVETDLQGNTLGEFGGSDLVLGLSGAWRPRYSLSVGATAKFIYEKIQDYSATGLAVDLGARYSTYRDRLTVGLAVQHLGAQLSSLGDETDKLPLTLRGGLALRPRDLPVVLSGDLILPTDNDLVVALGAEYLDFKPLFIRVGWNSFGGNYRTADSDDSWAGLGLGVGFDVKDFHISYAFAPGAELGDSHRITFTGGI